MNAKVFHADLWDLRENKYDWLLEHEIKTTDWQQLSPKSEFYLFVPRDEKLLERYGKYIKIPDIFPVNSVGIVTARDKLTISWSPEGVWTTIVNFSKMDIELARMSYNLGKDVRDWKVELAQKDILESGLDRNKIVPILYRPFDVRFTYYTGKSRGFHCMPRPDVMRHMMQENLGLCIGRAGQVVGLEKPWNIVFCSDYIEDLNLFYRGGNVNFPLYLYPTIDKKDLFSHINSGERQPNIAPGVFLTINEIYTKKSAPEDIFYYIYAVLYSTIYRTKYAEFLKTDFPRVPFTKDYKLFREIGVLGKKLADLHLLNSPELDHPISKFPIEGERTVETPKYDEENNRIYINRIQYFDSVPQDVWEYQIGGYQVCHKWLKDRKGRKLLLDDIRHYCGIVTSIHKTIEIQRGIDEIYPEIERDMIVSW